MKRVFAKLGFGLTLVAASLSSAQAQLSTAITYQGRLDEAGQPKTGTVDLRFDAFAAASIGPALNAVPVILDGVPLNAGVFTAQVDFGPGVFSGTAVFVEVGVREDAAGDAATTTGFTALVPRQEVTATPYALHATNVAANAIGGGQILNGSIGGADIGDGSLSAADVDTTSLLGGVQRRVAGECQVDRAAIRAINDDGTLRCIYLDPPTAIAPLPLDTTGDVGEHVSVVTSGSGAQIAYYDRTNTRLKYQLCTSTLCPFNSPIIVDDPAGRDVGQFASVAIVFPGPRIAYYDATGGDLKLALCASTGCAGTIDIRTLDSTGDVGRFASLALGADGFPTVAYYDATNNTYKLARCQDATCTTNSVTTLAGVTGGGVGGSAIAITIGKGPPAAPRIVLLDAGSRVTLVRCGNVNCNFNGTNVVLANSARAPISILAPRVISSSNEELPLWVGFTKTTGFVEFSQCDGDTCASPRSVTGTNASANVGSAQVMSLKPEQLPLAIGISSGATVYGLDFLGRRALQRDPTALSAAGVAQSFVAAAHYADGQVAVVYHDDAAGDLIYQRCARADCSDQ